MNPAVLSLEIPTDPGFAEAAEAFQLTRYQRDIYSVVTSWFSRPLARSAALLTMLDNADDVSRVDVMRTILAFTGLPPIGREQTVMTQVHVNDKQREAALQVARGLLGGEVYNPVAMLTGTPNEVATRVLGALHNISSSFGESVVVLYFDRLLAKGLQGGMLPLVEVTPETVLGDAVYGEPKNLFVNPFLFARAFRELRAASQNGGVHHGVAPFLVGLNLPQLEDEQAFSQVLQGVSELMLTLDRQQRRNGKGVASARNGRPSAKRRSNGHKETAGNGRRQRDQVFPLQLSLGSGVKLEIGPSPQQPPARNRKGERRRRARRSTV